MSIIAYLMFDCIDYMYLQTRERERERERERGGDISISHVILYILYIFFILIDSSQINNFLDIGRKLIVKTIVIFVEINFSEETTHLYLTLKKFYNSIKE